MKITHSKLKELTKTKRYINKYPKALEVLNALDGLPKDHEEWASRFNTAEKIIDCIG